MVGVSSFCISLRENCFYCGFVVLLKRKGFVDDWIACLSSDRKVHAWSDSIRVLRAGQERGKEDGGLSHCFIIARVLIVHATPVCVSGRRRG